MTTSERPRKYNAIEGPGLKRSSNRKRLKKKKNEFEKYAGPV